MSFRSILIAVSSSCSDALDGSVFASLPFDRETIEWLSLRAQCFLKAREAYPVLDESDYGRREYDAALENIEDAAWRIKSTYDLTDGWEAQAYEWLSAHRPGAVENKDDRGAYPSERDLQDAINAMGYVRRAD